MGLDKPRNVVVTHFPIASVSLLSILLIRLPVVSCPVPPGLNGVVVSLEGHRLIVVKVNVEIQDGVNFRRCDVDVEAVARANRRFARTYIKYGRLLIIILYRVIIKPIR